MHPILARGHADLLERPLLAHLATVRPNGQPQSSTVRFDWDGRSIRMVVAADGWVLPNLEHEPRASLSIADPERDRSLEVRATVEAIDADAAAELLERLAARYGGPASAGESAMLAVTLVPTTFLAMTDGVVVRAR